MLPLFLYIYYLSTKCNIYNEDINVSLTTCNELCYS